MSRQFATTEPPRPQAILFRFGLRSMLLCVGLLSVLFAAMSAVGGMPALALLLVAMVVAAHVLSTFVGTRLRDGATFECPTAAEGVRAGEHASAAADHRSQFVAAERDQSRHLQGRGSLVPRVLWLVAAGSLVGAGGFAALIMEFFWPKIGVAAIVAGVVAAGILGGWIVFLGFSFYVISRRAWREAAQTAPAGRASNRI